ncbi:MAG: hypothetical protein KDD42_06125, partial [Bdellovibrionales bacterium]|nr:hypothetical protein [Bdellovibrionales bacterium]
MAFRYSFAPLRVGSLIIVVVALAGCLSPIPTAPPTPSVIIQGDTPGTEEVQPIELDNCNGKADAAREEQRTRSVEFTISGEIAASLGASAEVISAEVQAAIGAAMQQGSEQSTKITLVAPPGTRMAFQLVWIGDEQLGIVQNLRASNIPIAFRSFTPTDVRIKSQYDIGCPPAAGQNGSVAPQPTAQPSQNPGSNAAAGDSTVPAPLRQFDSEHNIPPIGQSTLNIKVNDGELHIVTSGPICVSSIRRCLPGGANGEKRGSVVVLLPSENTYQLTGLVALENWHGSYYGYEEQAIGMAEKSARGMLLIDPSNLN